LLPIAVAVIVVAILGVSVVIRVGVLIVVWVCLTVLIVAVTTAIGFIAVTVVACAPSDSEVGTARTVDRDPPRRICPSLTNLGCVNVFLSVGRHSLRGAVSLRFG
jgi:hypothetical protein